jgi:hypothetical protein
LIRRKLGSCTPWPELTRFDVSNAARNNDPKAI